MKFMHFAKINEIVMFFCFTRLLQINSGEGLQKVVPKIIDIPLVKQAFRDGAFL